MLGSQSCWYASDSTPLHVPLQIPVKEAMTVLAAEWKTKSDAEKAQYKTA